MHGRVALVTDSTSCIPAELAAARGADEVVSVHISAGQSDTYQRALHAAAQSRVPVRVIDSRTTGMSLATRCWPQPGWPAQAADRAACSTRWPAGSPAAAS